ncbi:hypothetical protein BP5796_08122 [Coleophoma crateriformis]|uniref:Uncharacterized protein n=1 Tax=Coleophoma crateriformis TaxID=565419 RepID=A0A3D8RDU3_9HELO|nr:hypothetical protein BP5796_08122 [Coleophoma crateriformis]
MAPGVLTTSSLLTIIITTSVTPSAPSTELLSLVLESFRRHCPLLLKCRVIVVFDNYDRVTPTPRLKKGCVTSEQAADYVLYKENVKELFLRQFYQDGENIVFSQIEAKAEYGSPGDAQNVVNLIALQSHDKKVIFIEPSRRLGFGLAVRSALRMTETPYTWVHQHDWVLLSDFPIDPLLEIMRASELDEKAPIKYVCLPAIRMLSYAISDAVMRFPALRELTSSLKRDLSPASRPDIKIPLTPLFFWHDKPHIASTAHYLARIFPTGLAIPRGDFIEDTIGQRARTQMKEGLHMTVEGA